METNNIVIPDGYQGKIDSYYVKGTIVAQGGSCKIKEAVHEDGTKVVIKIMKDLTDQDYIGKYFKDTNGTRQFVTVKNAFKFKDDDQVNL